MDTEKKLPAMLDTKDIVQETGLSETTVKKHLKIGTLKSSLFGRRRLVRREDFIDWRERGAPWPAGGPDGKVAEMVQALRAYDEKYDTSFTR